MIAEREFLQFAESVLGVSGLTLETTYGSIPEWDSMAHLRLVMSFEKTYAHPIPFAEVTSVTSLWEFYRRVNGLSPKKVAAVDFDGILWKGVVGEDGAFALRSCDDFQRALLALKARGVLLVGLTKNTDEDARLGLRLCGGALTADDFVSIEANWQPKAENLLRAARTLNLSPESFVFFDDNPVERAQMHVLAPEVTVAAYPPRPEAYFPQGPVTDEDKHRTEQYREEAARRNFAETVSAADYLAGLDQHIDIHPIRPDEYARVAQLSQKANQYVLAVARYSQDEVRALAEDSERLFLTAHCRDRFGDLGLVGFASAKGAAVDLLTLSCRAAGRQIEHALADELKKASRAKGIDRLDAHYVPSVRNATGSAFANLFLSRALH